MIEQNKGTSGKSDMVKVFITEALAKDGNSTKIGENGSIRLKSFRTYCKKCGSDNVIILTNFSYSRGSEYTGIYGEEVILLFKCKDCGSAERIVTDKDYID